MKPVEHIRIRKGMKVKDLVDEFSRCGVMGSGKVAKAVDIFYEMHKDKDCKIFFGLAGAMVPGGMKEIILDLLKKGFIDIFVVTGANLTHDLVEALGYRHYQGSERADDVELNKKGIDRIYDSYMKNEVYQGLEDFMQKTLKKMPDRELSITEFLNLLGKYCPENSMLRVCYDKKIKVFCPALSDSGIGLQLWNFSQKNKLSISAFSDLNVIMEEALKCKKAGVFYVGGGVPKNYIQQAMQFSKGASYGIQITMDRVESGGSSGAELKEGISWGKLSSKARFVDIRMDATIVLPLIYSGFLDRV